MVIVEQEQETKDIKLLDLQKNESKVLTTHFKKRAKKKWTYRNTYCHHKRNLALSEGKYGRIKDVSRTGRIYTKLKQRSRKKEAHRDT